MGSAKRSPYEVEGPLAYLQLFPPQTGVLTTGVNHFRNFPNFSAAASSVSNFLQNANRSCRAPSRASR
jgi:hypothetical protein